LLALCKSFRADINAFEGSEIYVKDLCIKLRIIEVEMLDIINTLLCRPLSAAKSFPELQGAKRCAYAMCAGW